MRDDTILDRLAEAGSAREAARLFHFHGTMEKFESDPAGGGYDGVFWCADSPAVAQCYIPASGLESLMSKGGYQLGERVRPDRHSDWYGMVVQMGRESPSVEWGPNDQARSWAVPPGYPTYGDVCDWIEGTLGYPNEARYPDRERAYRIKVTYEGGRQAFLPSAHMAPGRLLVVDGLADLRFLDMAAGRDGDLTDLDYHKIRTFRRAEAEGYDGVIINDFCQSRTHGNVGHLSWGVLPGALHRIRHAVIPAIRFDWPEDAPCSETGTPEFEAAWLEKRSLAPVPGR